jgi:hypothetical protein
VALVAGLALIVAVAGASASVANHLAAAGGAVQAIACNTSGGSGGGC